MATILHLSFRVSDPERAAALYAELLDGKVVHIGPPLDTIGVKGVAFGRSKQNVLLDQIELWPLGKHWSQGGFIDITPVASVPFGHFAVESDKPYEAIEAVARKHGVTVAREERGVGYLVPVVYDHDGNFVELFAPAAPR